MRCWFNVLLSISAIAVLASAGPVPARPGPASFDGTASTSRSVERLQLSADSGYTTTQRATSQGSTGGLLLRLRTGAFDPLLTPPPDTPQLERYASAGARSLQLVQFPGPIEDSWYEALQDAGLDVVLYIPDYTYLIWGTEDAVQDLQTRAPVRWHGDFTPAYALHPSLQHSLATATEYTVVVQFHEHPSAASTRAEIEALATEVVRPAETIGHLTNLGVRISSDRLAQIASLPDVVTVEPLTIPAPLDEIQGQLMAGNLTPDGSRPVGVGYLTWLTATVGFSTTPTTYPIVDITDDGIDDGDDTPVHPDFYILGDLARPDRLVYNANWTTDPTADGGGGHGNINAAIMGGYNERVGSPYEDAAGYNLGLGINPFGRIAGSKIFGNTSGWSYPSYRALVAGSYAGGARIISNSWGDTSGDGGYYVDDQTYDALVRDADAEMPGEQPITILFSAGNSGYYGANTTASPANAKNVISVGANENYRPTWTDGCNIGAGAADNAHDLTGFSSRGPTDDGRVKPELVAPGTHVQGAAAQTPNYTGDYVCDDYHPTGQTLYAASSGTSHAAPAVAGAVSLLDAFYREHLGTSAPSPAMAKAYLVNAARYLDGTGTGDTLPSNHQGYGAVDLGRAFDTTPRIARDQDTVLHTTGASYTTQGYVARIYAPLRITLTWTDPPGPTVGDAYVNNLDLVVSAGGQTYLGNVFSGAHSTAGGLPDTRNNVESVFLPSGIHGGFTITVTAANLAGDGVLTDGDPTDQDFALVCYNCLEEIPTFHRIYLPLLFAPEL